MLGRLALADSEIDAIVKIVAKHSRDSQAPGDVRQYAIMGRMKWRFQDRCEEYAAYSQGLAPKRVVEVIFRIQSPSRALACGPREALQLAIDLANIEELRIEVIARPHPHLAVIGTAGIAEDLEQVAITANPAAIIRRACPRAT